MLPLFRRASLLTYMYRTLLTLLFFSIKERCDEVKYKYGKYVFIVKKKIYYDYDLQLYLLF